MLNYEILEATYTANMQYIQKAFPSLYHHIMYADISCYELYEEANGEINIIYENEKIYQSDIAESIQLQFDIFNLTQPVIFQEHPVAYVNNSGTINDTLMLKLQSFSTIINADTHESFFHGYKNLNEKTPVLLLFGVGNGKIVEHIVAKTNVDHLYIFDKDFAMLKISFHLMDWTAIFNYFFDNKRSLMFLRIDSDTSIKNSVASVVNDLFKYNPMYCFNLNVLTHYTFDAVAKLKELLQKKLPRALEGWGFYDDEINSIDHSLSIIKKKKPILSNKKIPNKLKQNLNIAIVANGPSLDDDIENLKKIQNTHIIISCGTAIKSLYKNGITPDFHIEIERDYNVYEALSTALNKEYLKTINLVGLNVLHPEVVDLFCEAYIYIRDNDSGGSLFPTIYPRLEHSNPLVANGALGFAIYLQPKNIYCFGMDMGSINPKKHHSASSDYYNPESFLSDTQIHFNGMEKGNFVDLVHTENTYLWSKQRLENCITKTKQSHTTIYNCSNGLFFEGSTPLHSSEIPIETANNTHGKKELCDTIKNLFAIPKGNNQKRIKNILTNNLAKTREIKTNIQNLSQVEEKDFDIARVLDSILQEVNDMPYELQVARSLLSGTLRIMISMAYTHALALHKNNQDYMPFAYTSLEIIQEFIQIVETKLQELIDSQ